LEKLKGSQCPNAVWDMEGVENEREKNSLDCSKHTWDIVQYFLHASKGGA
jgi:hypothetical protein